MDDAAKNPDEDTPLEGWRDSILEDVRRRLDDGELDSPAALLETAHAMLVGDEAPAKRKRKDDGADSDSDEDTPAPDDAPRRRRTD